MCRMSSHAAACPATLPFSYLGSASESSCMCPPGHACSTSSTPIVCPEGTFSPAGSLRGACQPCPLYMVSPAGAYTCLPTCPTVLTVPSDTYVVFVEVDAGNGRVITVFVCFWHASDFRATSDDAANPQAITVLMTLRTVVVSLAGTSSL
jgi:hypothetical protein